MNLLKPELITPDTPGLKYLERLDLKYEQVKALIEAGVETASDVVEMPFNEIVATLAPEDVKEQARELFKQSQKELGM